MTAAILLVGSLAAVLVGVAISGNAYVVALGVGLAPLGLLVLQYPFSALLIWAALLPYFLQGDSPSGEASAQMWLLHRLLIPGMLTLVALYHLLGIRRSAFKLHLYDLAIVGFLVLGVVSVLLTSTNAERMLVQLFHKVVVPISIFWYVRAVGVTRTDLRRLLVVGLVTIAVQGTIGVLSWVAPGILPDAWLGRAGERTTGTFGGPAPYTITLTFFALLVVHFAMRSRERVKRAALVAIVLFALIAIFLSLSRGSWLGVAMAFGGLVLLQPRLVVTITLLAGLLFGILAVGPLQNQVALASVRLETRQTIDDRLITNDAALRMIADRPVLGFGFQNFERFDEGYKRRVGDIPLHLGGSSHHTYLNMAVEMGIIGLTLYFIPVLALLIATVRARSRLPSGGLLGWPLVVVLWLAVLDQFVVSNFLEMLHAYAWGTSLWWFSLGLIATLLDRPTASGRLVGRDGW